MDDTTFPWRPAAAWTGGTLSDIALSPHIADDGVILAATAAGLYRSADGGRSWSLSMQGIDEPAIQLVRFVPASRTAFAATEQGRLYRSPDAGVTWQELGSWAGLGVAADLACSPAYGDDHTFFVATPDGVYRTLDDGRSWESCTFGLLDPDVLCIVCAPDYAASQVLWAGTALGGFFRSRNAGRAWRDSGAGLPDTAIQCVCLSPAHAADATLYVGTEGAGLYRSTDGGVTWRQQGDALAGRSVNCLAILQAAEEAVLLAGTDAGMFRSTDGGLSWLPVGGGEFAALALAVGDGLALAATYQEGVHLSTDQGRSFAPASSGLCAHTPPLAVHLEGARVALLDRDGRLAIWDERTTSVACFRSGQATVRAVAACRSGDDGTLFLVSDEGLLVGSTASLARDDWAALPLPVSEAADVAGLRAGCGADQPWLLLGDVDGGLYLSADGGGAWRQLPTPWQAETLLQAELWSADALGCRLAAVTAAPNAQGNYAVDIWESADSGDRWAVLASLETEAPGVLLATAATGSEQALFLATRHRLIKLQRDAGADGVAVSQHFFDEGSRISALSVSPHYAQDRTVYTAGSHGIYRSQDGGASWHRYGAGPRREPVVGILPGTGTPAEGGPLLVTLGGRIWRPD